jgi:hypothetical protein
MTEAVKPTFLHNGVTITLEASGRFSAMAPDGRITSGSLEGIKKALDKKGTFATFKAFTIFHSYRSLELQELTVIGVVEPKRHFGHRSWKVQDSSGRLRDISEVFEDTAANRAAAQAYIDMVKEHRKVRDEQEQAEAEARTKIKSREPEKKAA